MNSTLPLPELLMPAGDAGKAMTAFRYGADAVYMGCPMFSLRTRENTVTERDIEAIITYAHAHGKKVYVTTNLFPHDFIIPALRKHMTFLEAVRPDGIIIADMGVLALANELAPSVPKHLSVQSATMNVPALKMYQQLGVTRVICAREMTLREVKKIHDALPDMELEYFVHGSVCMAYSGRCLLSKFADGRDANCGVCNHACRWNYRVVDEEGRAVDVGAHHGEGSTKQDIPQEGSPKSIRDFENHQLWEEEERPGQYIPVEEDFHGTHMMSSRDMCMIEILDEVWAAGICSLKVEGRNKTPYYVASVARAYRAALDDLADGKPFDPTLWDEIHATANRGFFPGFAHGKPQSGDIQYEENRSTSQKEFCAVVEKWESGRLTITVKNRIEAGAELEVLMPRREDDFTFVAQNMQFGEEQVSVLHGGNAAKNATLQCEKEIPAGVFLRQKTQNPGLRVVPSSSLN